MLSTVDGTLQSAIPSTIQMKILVGYQGWTVQGEKSAVHFSSYSASVVQQHFHLMALHGIDGAFLQRFVAHGENGMADGIVDHVRGAAEKEGRVFAIMYNVTGMPAAKIEEVISVDWAHLIKDKKLLDSPNYLREVGKPVIALCGIGLAGLGHTPAIIRSTVQHIRTITPGGAYVMAGVPVHWQMLTGDADPNPEFLDVWHKDLDAISPWAVGSHDNDAAAAVKLAKEIAHGDIEDLKNKTGGRKVDYIPTIFPGGKGRNTTESERGSDDISRVGARFLWQRLFDLQKEGVRIIYAATGDEYSGGNTKASQLPALDSDLPSDWYLRICGLFGEVLRGGRVKESFPDEDLQYYWSIRPRYAATPIQSAYLSSVNNRPHRNFNIQSHSIDSIKILEVPLATLAGTALDLGLYATPSRFRFLDCPAFVDEKVLRIFEFSTLPSHAYAAISYPWRGIKITQLVSKDHFSVKGAEAGDHISIDVMTTACRASREFDRDLIWFDRLSISQTNEEDKNWQIMNMHDIYKDCTVCLVLSGGTTKLASLQDETTWIERAWTLQEAVLPLCVYVLFAWNRGNELISVPNMGDVHVVDVGRSAMAELSVILAGSVLGRFRIGTDAQGNVHSGNVTNPGDKFEWIPVKLFEAPHAVALKTAYGSRNEWVFGQHEQQIQTEDDAETKAEKLPGLWRCSWMRSASRPADMIFCMMGLFGVTLDPSKFQRDDRLGATIAFLQMVMRQGLRADWLAISLHLPPCPALSTLPIMPTLTTSGAVIQNGHSIQRISDIIKGSTPWYILEAPKGSVDELGYLRFTAKAVAVAEAVTQGGASQTLALQIDDLLGEKENANFTPHMYHVLGGNASEAECFAIYVGKQEFYLNILVSSGVIRSDYKVVMIVKRHGANPARFHRIDLGLVTSAEVGDGWIEKEFSVGGPEPVHKGVVSNK